MAGGWAGRDGRELIEEDLGFGDTAIAGFADCERSGRGGDAGNPLWELGYVVVGLDVGVVAAAVREVVPLRWRFRGGCSQGGMDVRLVAGIFARERFTKCWVIVRWVVLAIGGVR